MSTIHGQGPAVTTVKTQEQRCHTINLELFSVLFWNPFSLLETVNKCILMYNNSFCGAYGGNEDNTRMQLSLWREFRERRILSQGCWKSIAFPISAPHLQKALGKPK